MDLDELQSVRDAERGTDSLQGLPDAFYANAADHIADLKDEREERAEDTDDPFGDPEIQRLTSEIDAAEQVVEAIYERRVGKLVKLASFAAADMPADEDGLTTEEQDLFSDLVARIEDNRTRVLDVLAGEHATESDPDETEPTAGESETEAEPDPVSTADPAPSTAEGTADSDAKSGVSTADLMGRGDPAPDSGANPVSEPDESTTEPETEAESESLDRVTLRITRDVGEIVGIDEREYDLATEDVVTLPETNADPLIQRDAAERLD